LGLRVTESPAAALRSASGVPALSGAEVPASACLGLAGPLGSAAGDEDEELDEDENEDEETVCGVGGVYAPLREAWFMEHLGKHRPRDQG
jgi:hypothetical protein